MNAELINIYLWSALSLGLVINLIIYVWLKELIDFKIKSLFTKGAGFLFLDKTGALATSFQKVNKGLFKIKNSDYTLDTTVRNLKFLGVNTFFFLDGIPKNLDLLKGEGMYEDVRQDDIDTYLCNLTKANFLEWIYKYKDAILALLVIMAIAIGACAYFSYTNFEWVRDGAHIAVENILKPK